MSTKLFSIAVIVAATLPLAACVDPAEREDVGQSPLVQPPMMNTRPATFDCDDSGRVVVRPLGEDGRAVVLAFTNRELQLKSVPAPEGQKYSDGQTTFWMNGTNATLARAGEDNAESCSKN
ncbi:MAG: MliC family protein [Alphaproteobacteria bacterium]|nr:MliC family protein [Alphaproteobacteria bacterium]